MPASSVRISSFSPTTPSRAGSPALGAGELAAKYIAAQFERLGLEPAGDSGSFFQRVPVISLDPQPTLSASGPAATPLKWKDVTVLTIKPGFVDTPMTASKSKNSLYASPARVARGILRAIEARRNIVYLPWFWRPIMCVVDIIPESLFKRLRL